MSSRAIEDVRPSQVITTFGPGAIVDLQTMSVIVAGIDNWRIDEELVIHEPRLQRALRVERFFPATPTEGGFFSKKGTVPTFLFPQYQLCPVCRTLSTADEGYFEYDSKWQQIECKAPGCRGRGKFRATTLPAPFIVACPTGHIDDFPWREYVHRGPTNCRKRLTLFSIARTGSVADLMVKCECDAQRSASDAFGERRAEALGECSRRRPWLGQSSRDNAACPTATEVRAMQRGATNAWFPIVRGALAIKEAATLVGIALSSCNPKQIDKIDSEDKLRMLIDAGMFPSLEALPSADVWTAIQKQRGEIDTEEIDLRWPEWLAFQDPAGDSSDAAEFFLEEGEIPPGFEGLVSRVVLARKLLVLLQFNNLGYSRFNLMRASSVVKRQSIGLVF